MGKLDNAPMNQEVIQDFLNVPGIVGVALIDGVTPPYFYGFKTGFDASQQHIVAQSIQQVLETTPEGFNSFEFQFYLYRVYLHKLNQSITLLVLTDNDLSRVTYTQAVRRLLIELQLGQNKDPIAQFRALATEFSLAQSTAQPDAAIPNPPSNLEQPHVALEKADLLEPSSSPSLKDVLAAMNALSQLTTQYLGTLVVANYWKTTRPPVDWLNHFQIERSGQMTFSVQAPSERLPRLTHEQHHHIQTWVMAFIERCSKVIRDFAKIVRQGLDERQHALLFNPR